MNGPQTPPPAAPARVWIPWAVLALALASTAVGSFYIWRLTNEREAARFRGAVNDAHEAVAARIDAYVTMLRGASGLFAASDRVTSREFRSYVERLQLGRRYPGIQGIGYSIRVLPEQLEETIRRLREEGVTTTSGGQLRPFYIWPEHARNEYHAIAYLEPLDVRNHAAIGYDMFSEPTRAEAMAKARDTGVPQASGKVTLVQEIIGPRQPGFLIYLPLYEGGIIPPDLEQRRLRLTGFVYSPFRMVDLLSGIFGTRSRPGVTMRIYDGKVLAPEHLLYSSPSFGNEDESDHVQTLAVEGRTWTIVYRGTARLHDDSGRILLVLVPAMGTALSGVLFLLASVQARARLEAERNADELSRSAEALGRSESRLRRLVESNLVGVASGQVNGAITEANDAFLRLAGRTREDLASGAIRWNMLTPPDFQEADAHAAAELRDRGVCTPYEKAIVAADGSRVPVLVGIAMLEGSSGQCIAVVIDQTERQRSEEQRLRLLRSEQEARREAERANRMKDEFLATVSHELRTPLNAILGWAELLRSAPMDAQSTKQGMEAIERNARAQSQLIEDLLDVSRIISGKLRLKIERVDPGALLAAAVDTVRPAAQAKGIRIEQNLDPRVGHILADGSRLQQIAWNLLSNSVKFTPSGGEVRVTLRRAADEIEIVVSDTGQGISSDFLPHLFSPFTQADASTTRKHSGLGLGLSITRHLVELHGGTIQADSDGAGKGAVFTVRLPASPEPLPVEESAPPHTTDLPLTGARLDGIRVLAVDDDGDARELLRTILEQAGARVTVASCTSDALSTFDHHPPDVLLSDISMPGQDGYELIRAVRSLPPERGGRIGAIAVTAFARSEDRARSLEAGYDDHVTKPIDPSTLTRRILQAASRRVS